jgi:hypothetical protein
VYNNDPWGQPSENTTPTTETGRKEKVKVTLNATNPEITIAGESIADTINHINGQGDELKQLITFVGKVSALFQQTTGSAAPRQEPAPQQDVQASPPGAQQAPGGEQRYCRHGEMSFKSGISQSTEKPYSGWFCTAEKSKCDPQWPNKRKKSE